MDDATILKKIKDGSVPLDNLSEIMRGMEIGKSALQETGAIKIITGANIEKWSIKNYSYINQATLDKFKKNDKYFTKPRVLIRETGANITCLFLDCKLYSTRSLYSIISDTFDLLCLLAILNSKLIQFYYTHVFRTDTNIFPKIRITQVKQLPIKIPHPTIKISLHIIVISIILSKKRLNYSIDCFYNISEAIVFNLYFPAHMKERGIEVIDLVDSDLRGVLGERDFDNLEDSEKLAVIEKLNKMWSDPTNEAVKRINSFKEKSPDILKIILES